MDAEMLLNQAELVRAITLTAFDSLTEELSDIQPPGYNNTIRWNLGHILIVQEQLGIHFCAMRPQLPEHYVKLFGNRTKPADWTVEPPRLDTLQNLLKEQTAHIRQELGHRLDEAAAKPFVRLGREMKTIGEILNHSLFHEGIHIGAISGLKKAIASMK
jgi:uncharacterized damage-inducible protein DinB